MCKNDFKYKSQIEEIILDENYDFSNELYFGEVADFVSTAYVRFKQRRKIFDVADLGGYRVRFVNNPNAIEPASFVSVSDDNGTAVSEMCYPFLSELCDADYDLRNILSAFNEAYYALVN